MVWKTNVKEKKKKKRLTSAASGLEAHPSRPAPSFPRCWAARAAPPRFSSAVAAAAFFPCSLTDGARMSATSSTQLVTEPESSTAFFDSI
jgi:hypothetical protein